MENMKNYHKVTHVKASYQEHWKTKEYYKYLKNKYADGENKTSPEQVASFMQFILRQSQLCLLRHFYRVFTI